MEQFWHSLKHNRLISKGYPGYIKQYFSSITQIYQGDVIPAIKSIEPVHEISNNLTF